MKINRYFELNAGNGVNYWDVMEKSLIHTLPNGLQFYNCLQKEGQKDHVVFLVDKDMTILCRLIGNSIGIFIEEK